MNISILIIGLLIGFIIGFLVAYLIFRNQKVGMQKMVEDLHEKEKGENEAKISALLESTKSVFMQMSNTVLQSSTTELLKLAETKLGGEREISKKEIDGKKELIDHQLLKMTQELEKITNVVKEFEKERNTKYGELSKGIQEMSEQTKSLLSTTGSLREALSSSQSRGQWGQRMADDVLRLAGFIEGINYYQQKTNSESGSRPDYTFNMPNNLHLNMDVKFPFDNYIKFLDSSDTVNSDKYKKDFLKDVRLRLKELIGKDYIDPSGTTLDYVIMFIPNESVYEFIHENDKELIEDALKQHVVMCSPISLFAVLSIIRQSIDNFTIERTSNEILSLFGSFMKQWKLFTDKFEKFGDKIQSLQTDFKVITTTRKKALERPLDKIEDLRAQRAIPVNTDDDSDDIE
jgi:DNA recombination protein RmuC